MESLRVEIEATLRNQSGKTKYIHHHRDQTHADPLPT